MSKADLKKQKGPKLKKDGKTQQWLRRPLAIMVRLTEDERVEIKRLALSANVTISEYVRCKSFNVPFQHVGGRMPAPSMIGKNGEIARRNGDRAKI